LPVPSVTWISGFWPKGIGFYKWLADKGWDEAEAAKQAAGDKNEKSLTYALEKLKEVHDKCVEIDAERAERIAKASTTSTDVVPEEEVSLALERTGEGLRTGVI
jgi:hypothetical protein